MRELTLGLFGAVTLHAALAGLSASGDDSLVYRRLDHSQLLSALGASCESHHLAVNNFGGLKNTPVMVCRLRQPNPLKLQDLVLGVYSSSAAAARVHKMWQLIRPVWPAQPPAGDPIGDAFYWWVSPPEAPRQTVAILVRRRNVVFEISPEGSPADALALARRIDELIRDDRQIAPLGTFDPVPRIVDLGLPANLTVRPRVLAGFPVISARAAAKIPRHAFVRFQPQIQGMGPLDRLRIRVLIKTADPSGGWRTIGYNQVGMDGKSTPHLWVPASADRAYLRTASAQDDGRFILVITPLPTEPTTCKVTMIVANDDNLIVTKQATIQIAPEPQ